MVAGPVLLDTDTLSELSCGNTVATNHARAYLVEFGRFNISAVTVFERLRGYKQALRAGKPYHRQLQAFEALVQNCIVLPFDADAAEVAATIWASCSHRQQRHLGDILIAATAAARRVVLATRNTRDFKDLRDTAGIELKLTDWTAPRRTRA